MVLEVSYDEIVVLAKQHANLDMELSYNDNKSVIAECDVALGKVFGHELSKHVVARVKVEKFDDGLLHLTYDAGKGIELLVAGAQMLFPQFHHVKMVDLPDKGRAIIRLHDIPALREPLEKIALQDLSFTPTAARLSFALK
ncbi:MAG: hypothetical protein MJZ74_07535 [Muribaculaceae bacterium]|nr:hypothetical protein [Muribaculaceae bacterium]